MATLPTFVVDTGQMRPHEGLSLWRDAVPTHDVILPEDCDPRTFRARGKAWHLGTALLAETRSAPQRLVRTARAVRADQLDHYTVRLQKVGRWTGDVGGRTVAVEPGGVVVLDMARPSEACMTEIENINLVLPRDTLDDVLAPFDMHGLVLRNGMAALLRSHLSELAANLPELQVADAHRIADATLNLVAACLAPSRDTVERARAPLEAALIGDVRRYIDRHLHSPDLSPHSIGAALGLSRTALYAVCEPVGGVAAFIQKRRLKRIHAILADPQDRRRITEIAEQYGFTSGAHFSRAFRRAFGYAPSEARAAREAGAPRTADAGERASAGGAYATWVRRLGG